ncbi:hypothetical protein AQJ66_08750 [Streptomyces bungoensis]|uniref:ESX-1 secretion-associated protein n=1 Tax=Streptomyces bungoensis TaxID=285568 RepID=A0A124I4T2_9ACTN|nr:hypothetical protein [Streptomyces bungoensis]KUN87719.1 hypothetical protein AQJ66_08750 [Streptomyces bungoensis]
MGASSDGYTVRSGMSGQAKELDAAGDDAGKIREAIQPGMCYVDDVLGGPEAAAAFNAYAAAWEAEAKALESALHELADKVRLSKSAYHGSDSLVGTSAHGVAVGESHLTGTRPAQAGRPSALAGY